MDARLARFALALLLAWLLALTHAVSAAGYRTRNFAVAAPTPQLAKEIGAAAEHWRRALSIEWIGEEMPPWSQPCPIHARVSPNLGAGGATSFVFDQGEVFDWRMNIQGSRERILDSVLPHEVTHTIFACYFRQPLPRWADEGACTTVEHPSEIAKQERMLIDQLRTGRSIPFSRMFSMKEYPQDVMPLYSQGHALAEMLLESRGKQEFLDFLSDGMRDDNWPRAVRKHYDYENLYALQTSWLEWVKAGRPQLGPAADTGIQLAANTDPVEHEPVVRAQSPDQDIRPIPPAASPLQSGTSSSVYANIAARANSGPPQRFPASRHAIHDAPMRPGVLRR